MSPGAKAALALVVLAALTAGCGGHHAASDEAILAVQKSARGKAFWFFPSRATSVRCAIPGFDEPGTELYADDLIVRDEPFDYALTGNCAYRSTFHYSS